MKLLATVEIEINAPQVEVFDAILDPTLISQWMFGPNLRDEKIVHIEIDPRPNGVFSYLVDRNGVLIDHVGRFLLVDRPAQLQFTWAIGKITEQDSIVSIKIASEESVSTLTLTHDIPEEWSEYLERTKAGWEKMLSKLKMILQKEQSLN
jgi:uncharacterized protein YndB with AHSA1/START domain